MALPKPTAQPLPAAAPNISINLHGGSSRMELLLGAIFGVLVQLAVLIFSGCTVYHPTYKEGFKKDGEEVESYAYPLFAVGTVILSVGMLICAAVIERSTTEDEWSINTGTDSDDHGFKARILWLQKSHVVSDQTFNSFVIFANQPRKTILSSRRTMEPEFNILPVLYSGPGDTRNVFKALKHWWFRYTHRFASGGAELWTLLGTLISLAGFVCQFQGMRGLNWVTSVSQLIAIAIMTLIRAWVRRGLIAKPLATEALDEHEMDWLAIQICGARKGGDGRGDDFWPVKRATTAMQSLDRLEAPMTWEVVTGLRNVAVQGRFRLGRVLGSETPDFGSTEALRNRAEDLLRIRQRLRKLTQWTGKASKPAVAVAAAIDKVMNTINDYDKEEVFEWYLNVRVDGVQQRIKMTVSREQDGRTWRSDWTEIEAVLSLWIFHILSLDETRRREEEESNVPSNSVLQMSDFDLKRYIIQVLGPVNEELKRDILWWIGDHGRHPFSTNEKRIDLTGGHMFNKREIFIGHIGMEPTFIDSDNDSSKPPSTKSSVRPPHSDDVLAVLSDATLELALAQHVFSSFMWAITSRNNWDILTNGSTLLVNEEVFRIDAPSPLSGVRLENKALVDIVSSIHRTGLGTSEEIYFCMIPALSVCKRLPMRTVLDLVRLEARDWERRGHWGIVLPVYERMYEICKSYGVNHDVRQTATAMLLDVYRSMNHTIEQRISQDRENDTELETLKQLRSDLVALLFSVEGDGLNEYLDVLRFHDRLEFPFPSITVPTMGVPTSHTHQSHDPTELTLRKQHDIFTQVFNMTPDELRKLATAEHITIRDTFGRTLLHYAAVLGDVRLIRALVRVGADPKAVDIADWTPLHYAVESMREPNPSADGDDDDDRGQGPQAVIWALLQTGGDMEMHRRDGTGVLHVAAKYGNAEIVALFLQAGANIEMLDNFRRTPLHYATLSQSLETMGCLLRKHAFADARDTYGRTPLHVAAADGNEAVIALLLEEEDEDIDTDAKDRDGRTPLLLAARHGRFDAVATFAENQRHSFNFNAKDNQRHTALHLAVMYNHPAIVKLLLHGRVLDVHSRDHEGLNAMHIAASMGAAEILSMLLPHYHDKNQRDLQGRSALFHAVEKGHEEASVLLLKAGADIELRNNDEMTPLHIASSKGHAHMVRLLLSHGADIEGIRKFANNTPLHYAADEGHPEVVHVLAEAGCNLYARHYSGATALYRAVAFRHPETVKVLLAYDSVTEWTLLHRAAATMHLDAAQQAIADGIDINKPDNEGWTPFHLAAASGNDDMIKLLIEAGADLEAQMSTGFRPLDFAAERGHVEAVNILLSAGAKVTDMPGKWTALHCAGWQGNLAMAKALISHGANLECRENKGQTPLHWAAWQGHKTVAAYMLKNGADARVVDEDGRSPLHWSCAYGYEMTSDTLIYHWADIDLRDKEGKTPLDLAIANGNERLIRLLLGKGPDLEGMQRKTGLIHRLVQEGKDSLIKLLLDHGLDVDSRDEHGRTALHVAVMFGRSAVLRALVKRGATVHVEDNEGLTPLWMAAKDEEGTMVDDMLKSLAATSRTELALALTKPGHVFGTPIQVAFQRKNKDIVTKLAKAGSGWMDVDAYGWDLEVLCRAMTGRTRKLANIYRHFESRRKITNKLSEGPTAWSQQFRHPFIDVAEDGVTAKCTVRPLPDPLPFAKNPNLFFFQIEGNLPYGRDTPIYFEITILNDIAAKSLAFGFSNGHVDTNYPPIPERHCWWVRYNDWTAPDAESYTHTIHLEDTDDFELEVAVGDVLGCGVDHWKHMFLTKNGAPVGKILFGKVAGQLFPVVALTRGGEVKADWEASYVEAPREDDSSSGPRDHDYTSSSSSSSESDSD